MDQIRKCVQAKEYNKFSRVSVNETWIALRTKIISIQIKVRNNTTYSTSTEKSLITSEQIVGVENVANILSDLSENCFVDTVCVFPK